MRVFVGIKLYIISLGILRNRFCFELGLKPIKQMLSSQRIYAFDWVSQQPHFSSFLLLYLYAGHFLARWGARSLSLSHQTLFTFFAAIPLLGFVYSCIALVIIIGHIFGIILSFSIFILVFIA